MTPQASLKAGESHEQQAGKKLAGPSSSQGSQIGINSRTEHGALTMEPHDTRVMLSDNYTTHVPSEREVTRTAKLSGHCPLPALFWGVLLQGPISQ